MRKDTTAAAETGSATPTNPDMQLVIQSAKKNIRPHSTTFDKPNPVDYGALVIFSMLSRYTPREKQTTKANQPIERTSQLEWASGAFKNTHMNYDVWMEILGWLLEGNAQRLCLDPTLFPTNQERLEQLAIPIRRLESRACIPPKLFAQNARNSQNYQRRFEIAYLLTAALNADHTAVEKILDGKDSDTIKIMLSTPGTAIIAHLGIKRMGTPLQMALYNHDETLFKMLADKMESEEIKQQCATVFKACKVENYDALIEKQIAEAKTLCDEIGRTLRPLSPTDTDRYNNDPFGPQDKLESALKAVVHLFSIALDKYVRANPIHNPYILARLYGFYDQLPSKTTIEITMLYLLSKPMGLTQKLSSARWLQHYAQGIYYLSREKNPVAPLSSFSCRGSSALDIRSDAVLSRLGSDRDGYDASCCIDVNGHLDEHAGNTENFARFYPLIKTVIDKKQQLWKEYTKNISASASTSAPTSVPASPEQRGCPIQ